MPRNPVVENVCDRCTRSWYTKVDEKQLDVAVNVSYAIGDSLPLSAKFNCLCEGCQKTVLDLVKSITKVMTKSAPIRGAKKAEGEANAPPTTSQQPPPPAKDAAPQPPVAPTVAASAGKAPSASVPPSAAPASQHPKR
jgi:hypothetical protein